MVHPTNNKTLKQKIVWHLKVVAGALLISILFGIILNQKIVHDQSLLTLFLTFCQLEIFIWLGAWFFESVKVDSPNFKRKILVRLLVFYISVLAVAFVFFVIIYIIQYSIHFNDFKQFFSNLFTMEMKGFFIATFVGFTLGALFFFYIQWNEAVDRVHAPRCEDGG